MEPAGQAKWSARALLAGPDGHPFHPMLVTVPIGAWVASLLFDIASHLLSHPAALARGSELLVGVGVLGALLAGAAGLVDLMLIPPRTPAFRTACTHMLLNLMLTIAYAGNLAWRYKAGPHGAVPAGLLGFSAASVAALFVSGYLGGKLTYRYGMRVAVRLPSAGDHVPGQPVRRGAGTSAEDAGM